MYWNCKSRVVRSYEQYDSKVDTVIQVIDSKIWSTSEGRNEVYEMLMNILMKKFSSWNLSNSHQSILSYLLSYYHYNSRVDSYIELASSIFDQIENLQYFTCEVDADCSLQEPVTDAAIQPSLNQNYQGENIINAVALPSSLPHSTGSFAITNEITSKASKCFQSYCRTEVKSSYSNELTGENENRTSYNNWFKLIPSK